MKRSALAFAAAAIGATALVASSPAEARWRGGWGGGWGPGIAAGLVGAAVIGGLASSAYAYGPGYGYDGYPGYGGYYGYGYGPGYGYAPAYSGYGYGSDPYAWGGDSTTYYTGYAPAYRYRRIVRPAYAYYGVPHRHLGAFAFYGAPRVHVGYHHGYRHVGYRSRHW